VRDLLMVKNPERRSRIHERNRIATKIKSIPPRATPHLSTKFHQNPFITFRDILHTDGIGRIHNLLGSAEVTIKYSQSETMQRGVIV